MGLQGEGEGSLSKINLWLNTRKKYRKSLPKKQTNLSGLRQDMLLPWQEASITMSCALKL